MADPIASHDRSDSDSSVDVDVDNDSDSGNEGVDVEILMENAANSAKHSVEGSRTSSSSNSSGFIDRDCPKQNTASGESSIPNHHAMTGWSLHNSTLSKLLTKLLDERVHPRKKLKWLKRFATVKRDGTVEFDVPTDIKPPSPDFGTGMIHVETNGDEQVESIGSLDLPPMQIVMLIVGTRGDVQPFVAIGKCLQEHGHRVRLATHRNFKDFVLTAGLEFFPLGGDPKVLAGYMVKNKGFLPSDPSEIPTQRNQIKEIVYSLLPACKDPDPDSKVPFRADAIIANPPAYGHTHAAEALKVPIHVFFTMPWTPTSEFPHPLSRVKQPVAYKLSYQVVDAMIWLGIRDVVNECRKKQLKLRRVTYLSPSYSSPPEIPYGYIWSPHLVPKPKDWGPKIDVVGFCFLDLASNYQPPEELVQWLASGPKPIYVGFGSLGLLVQLACVHEHISGGGLAIGCKSSGLS